METEEHPQRQKSPAPPDPLVKEWAAPVRSPGSKQDWRAAAETGTLGKTPSNRTDKAFPPPVQMWPAGGELNDFSYITEFSP